MNGTDFIAVLQRLQEGWGAKLGVSFALAVAAQEHVQIFVAFFTLVCLDLATKWISLSRVDCSDALASLVAFSGGSACRIHQK